MGISLITFSSSASSWFTGKMHCLRTILENSSCAGTVPRLPPTQGMLRRVTNKRERAIVKHTFGQHPVLPKGVNDGHDWIDGLKRLKSVNTHSVDDKEGTERCVRITYIDGNGLSMEWHKIRTIGVVQEWMGMAHENEQY
jgi:hypothetical protein